MTDAPRRRLNRRALTGFGWAYGSFTTGRAINFLATLVLARLLLPEQFGLVVFALALLAYMENLTDLGVGAALVYRSDAHDPRIASTAFWIGIVGALVLVAISWVAAGYLPRLGAGPEVTPIFRALSLQILLTALGSVHEYLLRHSLGFKRLLVPELGSGLVKGVVSVGLALSGAGVWSLVIGQLAGSLTRTVSLWSVIRWRPQLTFAGEHFGSMLKYGLGITAVAILGEAGRNVDYLIVGAQLGSTALGFYFLAFRVPELVVMPAFRVGGRVLFSFYSRLGDLRAGQGEGLQKGELAEGYLQTVRLGALLAFPAGFGIAALASPIVLTLFGARWEPSIAPLALIGVWAAVSAVATMPGSVFKAIGRSDLLTATSMAGLLLLLPALWFSAPYGIAAVAGAHVISKSVHFVLLAIVTGRMLETAWLPAVLAVVPALAMSLIMAAAVYGVALALPPLAALFVGTATGALVYLGLMRILLPREFRMLVAKVAAVRARRGAASPLEADVGGP